MLQPAIYRSTEKKSILGILDLSFISSFFLISCFSLFISLPAQATQLQGRIEEINDNPDVKLPDQQPSAAQPSERPVQSFPAALKGQWSGKLQISKSLFSQLYTQLQPADYAREREAVVEGGQADAYFRFLSQRPGVVTMAPPEIKIRAPGTSWLHPHYVYIAIADFAANGYQSMSGDSTIKSALMRNDVKMLSANVVEQDTVVQQVLIDKANGTQKVTYVETVYRFTTTKPSEMHADVAQVQYGSDGSWWEKVVLAGDLH